MLNFESIGSPVAKIMDKTSKKEQIVYLSDPELDGEVRNGYSNIKLESHQSFQQISDNKERNILLAPHTSGPRDVPRCGALSLLQKTPHYRGDPAETAVG